MESNESFTVWIGDRRIAISAGEIEKLRSARSELISGFSDAELAATLAQSQFATSEYFESTSRINVWNSREMQLLQEAHASIPLRAG